ncbi:MAG: serine hydrolase [Acidobacteriota bacterium]|nr:serine hydrolase [Acidobacteriota bacterium]
MKVTVFLFLLILLGYQPFYAQKNALDRKIKQTINGFQGSVWIYAKNLSDSKTYEFRADERVRTASTIKLAIMVEVFAQVAENKLNWNDKFILKNKTGGSGILGEFTEGTELDLKTLVNLMIVVSDNTATNMILDKIGTDAVNERMEKLGFRYTRALRKIGGGGEARIIREDNNRFFGIGVSTMREMGLLLEKLEKGEIISRQASNEMLSILRRQQYTDGIGRGLLDTTPVASKSGALDRLRSDVGIVYTRRGPIVIAITIDDMPWVLYNQENPGLKLIWKLSKILLESL